MTKRTRETGPEEWEDGLPGPPQPVPAWFTVLIILAVLGCIVGAYVFFKVLAA